MCLVVIMNVSTAIAYLWIMFCLGDSDGGDGVHERWCLGSWGEKQDSPCFQCSIEVQYIVRCCRYSRDGKYSTIRFDTGQLIDHLRSTEVALQADSAAGGFTAGSLTAGGGLDALGMHVPFTLK